LTIPPGATTGGSWLAPSPPDTCFTPLTAPCALWAFTVIVTPEPCPLLVCQVASQRPLASGLKLKAGSPLENSAVTEPASSAVPQLSRTSTLQRQRPTGGHGEAAAERGDVRQQRRRGATGIGIALRIPGRRGSSNW